MRLKKQPKIEEPTLTASDDFIERRKAARLDIPIKVEYRVIGSDWGAGDPKDRKNATTKNISAGGCLLLMTEKIKEGTVVELQIFLGESDSELLRLKGTIVRINREEGGLFEYGISFVDIGKDARRLFADFCFSKMYEMIGLSEWPTDRRTKTVSRIS